MRATVGASGGQLPALRAALETTSHLSAVTLLRVPGGGSARSSQAAPTDLLICDALCLHCEVGQRGQQTSCRHWLACVHPCLPAGAGRAALQGARPKPASGGPVHHRVAWGRLRAAPA